MKLSTAVFRLAPAALLLTATPALAQTVHHVDANAAGPVHDGSSWCSAYLALHEALDVAVSGDTIMVAEGTYLPDPTGLDDPREATFQLINGVTIRGGYAGCGAPHPNERDPTLYQSILSGDLNQNDDTTGNAENAYHVVTASGVDDTAVLDGMTVTAGNANGAWWANHQSGGGMQSIEGHPTLVDCTFTWNNARAGGAVSNLFADPTFTRCVFTHNSALKGGGGMFNLASSPALLDCRFGHNSAGYAGGGTYNTTDSGPQVVQCEYYSNRARFGAGMCNVMDSNPTVTACVFDGNAGVGLWPQGGGMYNKGESVPTLSACTFTSNSAGFGGGLASGDYAGEFHLNGCVFEWNSAYYHGAGISNHELHGGPLVGSAMLVNCLFYENAAAGFGGGMYTRGTSVLTNCTFYGNSTYYNTEGGGLASSDELTLTNCILWENGIGQMAQVLAWGSPLVIDYSCVQGWTGSWGGVGNIGDDPLFADPGGSVGTDGAEDYDLHLATGSPCIDAGDNAAVPEDVTTGLDGYPRFHDDPDTDDTGNGDPPIVDMGVYEFRAFEMVFTAVSVGNHSGEELSLDLIGNNIEPRQDGVTMLRFGVSGPVSRVGAAVSCSDHGYGGMVVTSTVGSVVTVAFTPALPDADCCQITLGGDAVGTVSVRTLRGDVDRDGVVTGDDLEALRGHFGADPAVEGPQFDFNQDGQINSTDFSRVKLFLGNQAPVCP